MNRIHREIHTWGTVLYCEAASSSLTVAELEAAMDRVRDYVERIDEVFSTYKSESEVSRLRRGEISIGECSEEVREVWALCERGKFLSDGAFDPWAVEGGFDPSGIVKGWATDVAAQIMVDAGAEHVQINSAGDLALRGGDGTGKPWAIGVVNPGKTDEVVQVFHIQEGAIATSGDYERGAHIRDPFTGTIAIGARSATVVGPEGWLCEVMATALMVTGEDGAALFSQPELVEYSAFVIDRHADESWALGPLA